MAQETVPEYDLNNFTLTIPEVKVGNGFVYNAKMTFDGKQTFTLLGFDNANPNIPPVGKAADLEQWLMKGSYKNWQCEANPHPQTRSSPHGVVRVCSNPLLSKSADIPFPVGAASVKELYAGNTINGYAVGVKIKAGEGAETWYWYERVGNSVEGDGIAAPVCEGCHAKQSTDRVFIVNR